MMKMFTYKRRPFYYLLICTEAPLLRNEHVGMLRAINKIFVYNYNWRG